MRIWTVITDDCNGTTARVFANEEAADAAALDWCKQDWPFDTPCPEDWREAYTVLEDFDDTRWVEEHDLLDTAAIAAVRTSARAQLDHLLEQIHQMKGMFDDADGAIASAIADAEAWPDLAQDKAMEVSHAKGY